MSEFEGLDFVYMPVPKMWTPDVTLVNKQVLHLPLQLLIPLWQFQHTYTHSLRKRSRAAESFENDNMISRRKPIWTRNSAVADKPRDAFRGQSRSSNMAPFHMLCMVSYYCPIVTFSVRNIRLQKCRDLETGLRVREGHWKCLHSTESPRLPIMFYCNYGSISCRIWDIQCRKISRPWNRSQKPIKVIESGTIRQTGMVSYYCSIVTLCPRDIRHQNAVTLQTGLLKMSPFDRAHMTSY